MLEGSAECKKTRGDPVGLYGKDIRSECGECAVQCIYEAMKVVWVMSHSTQMLFGRLMEDALCMLNFDGGKVGIRRRQLPALIMEAGFDALSAGYGNKH
jgi:hypothetical protein